MNPTATDVQQNLRRTNEIRVFISSTFVDLMEEREYLVKHIFPEIRSKCRERGVEFTEIDLRWGITADESEEGQTIKTCLTEVDRCRPYFIGILGSRYGWQPTYVDVLKDPELLLQFPWVEDSISTGMSVTEMEISYGALHNPHSAPHAYFYFRRPSEIHEDRVEKLREQIRRSNFPIQEDFDSVEELGEQVRKDLLATLEETFPADALPSELEIESRSHESYAHTRRRAYVPNPEYLRRLTDFVNDEATERKPMVVIGGSGSGKSSLLAFWSNEFKHTHPGTFFISHYVGALHSSPAALIRHVMMEINGRTEVPEEIPLLADELETQLPQWLAKLQSQKIVILLDAVNQLEDPRGEGLNWLPNYFPPNIYLILSTTEESFFGKDDHSLSLKLRNWQELLVLPLDASQRREVISHYLNQYHKTLNASQLHRIAENVNCSSPLFLRTVLEELRIFGKYEELDERINYFLASTDSNDLFQRVLERMEEDYGKLVLREMMSLIWSARRGLSETELIELLPTHSNDKQEFTRFQLSRLLHVLDYHLIRKEGLLGFFHNYLRNAVEARYITSKDEKIRTHERLAQYFRSENITHRRVDEEPYHWMNSEIWDGLCECLTQMRLLEILLGPIRRNELIGYWMALQAHFDLGTTYHTAITDFEDQCTDELEFARLCTELGNALISASCYGESEYLLRLSLGVIESLFGEDDMRIADGKRDLATLFYYTGNFDDSEKLFREAISIQEQNLSENDVSIAKCLNDLGAVLFQRDQYESAESIWSKVINMYRFHNLEVHPDVASTLNNLGSVKYVEKKYAQAIDYYSQSLKVYQKLYGDEHTQVINLLGNLALAHDDNGNTSEAERLYIKALDLSLRVNGPLHTDVSMQYSNIAIFYSIQQNYSKAIEMQTLALEIRKKIMGERHFLTVHSYLCLGLALVRSGKITQGERLLQTYLPIQKKLLGESNRLITDIERNWQEVKNSAQYKFSRISK